MEKVPKTTISPIAETPKMDFLDKMKSKFKAFLGNSAPSREGIGHQLHDIRFNLKTRKPDYYKLPNGKITKYDTFKDELGRDAPVPEKKEGTYKFGTAFRYAPEKVQTTAGLKYHHEIKAGDKIVHNGELHGVGQVHKFGYITVDPQGRVHPVSTGDFHMPYGYNLGKKKDIEKSKQTPDL